MTGERTLGILLAGGLARRMGGGDKPLREIGGKSLLAHVIERMHPQCEALVLNANGAAERFSEFGLPVVADSIEGFAGPLAGVLAGLDWATAHAKGLKWAVSIATDTPFLPRDLVQKLHAARVERKARLASAASGGRTHPVIGLWPIDIREELRVALEEGWRKIDLFTARHTLAIAEWSVLPYDPFFNANAPDDLAQAEGIARTSAA
ncbi:MAG: molybdenum cofactor guanylyltransferase MobA [Hyphomicrobiales bacterium]|nr:molybdenum cofactor guanylyltransferase MobA [Hyphomicrobiales bacterium]